MEIERKKYVVDKKNRIIFLADYKFWAEREDELKKWCKKHACVFKGMTIQYFDDNTLTLFGLTWS